MSKKHLSPMAAEMPSTLNGAHEIVESAPAPVFTREDFLAMQQDEDIAGDMSGGLADWNLEELRVKEDFGVEVAGEPVVTSVQVRKPTKQEWIRVRPGQAWRFHTAILTVDEDRSSYLVAPPLWDELAADVALTTLYTTITRAGALFLWPVRMVLADRPSGGDTWNRSAHDAARLAETAWVRLTASQAHREYQIRRATGLADPVWPSQIDAFETLMRLAFKDRFIASLDHPVVRRLRGDV